MGLCQWLSTYIGIITFPLSITGFGIIVNNAISTSHGDHAEASPRSGHIDQNTFFVGNGTDINASYVIIICSM